MCGQSRTRLRQVPTAAHGHGEPAVSNQCAFNRSHAQGEEQSEQTEAFLLITDEIGKKEIYIFDHVCIFLLFPDVHHLSAVVRSGRHHCLQNLKGVPETTREYKNSSLYNI